jgi:hypothetical protein
LYKIRYIQKETAMPQEATLHVKIDPATARGLKAIARTRGRSVGELVRQAIASCYQPELLDLTAAQRQALEAYRGGFISLGKLAEAMGRHVLRMREWLREHGIPENSCYAAEDR